MAYLNPLYITDEQAKDIYTRETVNVANIVTLVDLAVEAFVQSKGVSVDDIPVDGSGYAISYVVIQYARYHMYIELLDAYRGSSHGDIDDIYQDKSEEYQEKLTKVEADATVDAILSNTDLPRTAFIGSVVLN